MSSVRVFNGGSLHVAFTTWFTKGFGENSHFVHCQKASSRLASTQSVWFKLFQSFYTTYTLLAVLVMAQYTITNISMSANNQSIFTFFMASIFDVGRGSN